MEANDECLEALEKLLGCTAVGLVGVHMSLDGDSQNQGHSGPGTF